MRTLQLLFMALLAAALAPAAPIFDVHVDTSGLAPGGAYSMDFQFIGSNANTMDLSGFTYGGGSGPAGAFEMSTVSNFFNELAEPFTAGASLNFRFSATNIGPAPGGFPDELSFFLLDSAQNVLATSDTFADAFFYLDVTGGAPSIQTFSGSGVPAPVLTAATVPEPGGFSLAVVGLAVLLVSAHKSGRFVRSVSDWYPYLGAPKRSRLGQSDRGAVAAEAVRLLQHH